MRRQWMTTAFHAAWLWLVSLSVNAQVELPEQAKPWFLVIMDTSGSMDEYTDLDGALDGQPPNRCGYESRKLNDAKCALKGVVESTGDAAFGLMQFDQLLPSGGQQNCCTGGRPNPNSQNYNVCDSAWGTCDGTAMSGKMLAVISDTNQSQLLAWVDEGSEGSCATEMFPAGSTPLEGALWLAQDYFEGNAPPPFDTSPTATDAYVAQGCRSVYVILLTDGDETCDGTPVDAARGLHTSVVPISGGGTLELDIRTYVIGFGIGEGDEDIEAIAEGGCTCAGTYDADSCAAGADPGCDPCGGACTGNRGFYPEDEQELSAAFNQIIADAQLAPEICNDKDDNCNGLIDEGIVKYCDRPNGIEDLVLCEPPEETECDGVDDNCDGRIDEGLLNDCGFCGEVPEEVCDGLDNDCDGATDEGVEEGAECGKSEGACEPGTLRCIDGEYVCINERGPGQEQCNCIDDDCDGETDEDPEGNLCPPGYVCFQCECVPLCALQEEFGKCQPGRMPIEDEEGRCLCVEDPCDKDECASLTRERDGKVICGPDREEVAPCKCIQGVCLALCEAVECESEEVCDPKTGVCVGAHCGVSGCDQGERCDALSGQCVRDACATTPCGEDEVCRDGECEPSCAHVQCSEATRCQSGECVPDNCADVLCQSGEVCDPDTGACIHDACAGQRCDSDLKCDPVTGDCVADACAVVRCPEGQACRDGECFFEPNEQPQNEQDNGDETDLLKPRYVSAAGGGCGCSVPGRTGGRNWAPIMGCGFGFLLFWARRRRPGAGRRSPVLHGFRFGRAARHRAACGRRAVRGAAFPRMAFCRMGGAACGWWAGLSVLGLAAAWAVLLQGCQGVTPFCVANCSSDERLIVGDAAMDAGRDRDAGGGEAGQRKRDAARDAATEAGAGCEDDAGVEDEICNGLDDDCDGRTDEDLAPPNGFCGRAGVCEGVVAQCDSRGRWTCDFPDEYQFDETLCDGLDNDCDGDIDEGFPGLGTPCSVGIGACRGQGEIICDSSGTGSECSVVQPASPEPEICDGMDNDCDGEVDESKSAPGSHPNYVVEDMVQVDTELWIYAYEASRPDAARDTQGTISERSCSRAGVLPWTNLTYAEAGAACTAAGLRLCTADEWQQACRGSTGTCNWAYTPTDTTTCNDYVADGGHACNGKEFEDPSLGPGRWLLPTGYLPECYAEHGSDERVYDMSGNVKEWAEGSTPGVNPLRGGSMNDVAAGLRCDFDFAAGNDTFQFQNVGFRCCSSEAP